MPRTLDPAVDPAREPPANRETDSSGVAGVVPGDESGRIDRTDDSDSALRRGLRGALFVPRLAVDAVLSPVRLSMWAYDHYHLDELYDRVFFNDARTIGLVPTASYDSSFGIAAGAQFVDRDIFGAREHLLLEAVAGGRSRQIYKAVLRSGRRLGDHLGLELGGQYELRPGDTFHGIGNDAAAAAARTRERLARVAGVIDVQLFDGLHLRSASELTDRTFSASDTGRAMEQIDEPGVIVGYDGVRSLYSELELRFDGRRRFDRFEPRPFYSVGSLAAVFGGRVHRLDGAPDYWRYGADLQHFIRLTEGPRVLALRLRGEAVSGSRSEVPFIELPALGGAEELRGYPIDRFRDRAFALGSIEYEWDLSALAAASLFVDAGRVFASLGDVSSDHMRIGYGLAFQAHTENSFGFRGSVASSIDGGVMFSLSLNPVFGLDERVRRR